MAADDNMIEVAFEGKTHKFELTLGEIEEIEDAFNTTIDQVDLNRTKAALLLVKFALMRETPDADPRRVMADLRSRGISVLVVPDEPEERPTPAKAKAAKAAATAGS
jgi:hypothetical protein